VFTAVLCKTHIHSLRQHIASSKASSSQSAIKCFLFKFQYSLVSWRSSSSCLRLIPCIPVTSIAPSTFTSIMCPYATCARQKHCRKYCNKTWSWWQSGLREGLRLSAAWDCGFQSPQGRGSCLLWVLSGTGLCVGPLTHPGESYRLCVCHWACSRNLKNEGVLVGNGLLRDGGRRRRL
jgi:hypothetical protein